MRHKFNNPLLKVSVSFAERKQKPGEKTNLILKASPGSRVAFVAVDKSIHIFKAGNELTKDKVNILIITIVMPRKIKNWDNY